MPISLPLLALCAPALGAGPFALSFDDGVDGWRVVLDGVMGGRSSGRVEAADGGTLQFTGNLSLENNGGFAQIRTSVPDGAFDGARGIDLRVLGDGRTYKFDVRTSNARRMAGGFQAEFATEAGAWTDVHLPFETFALHDFGRRVADAPALDPRRVESIGVTLADKNAGAFRLAVDRIAASSAAGATSRPPADDLATVASAAGLTTLLDLVDAADLELPAEGRFTILAPTDDAFAALPTRQVQGLLRPEGRETLRRILLHHVVAPALPSSSLLDRRAVDTLGGQRLSIDPDAASVGGATMLATDVAFDRGVVHVVDAVLLPESRPLPAVAAADGRLEVLLRAVRAAGLGSRLGPGNGDWTVLAPTDDAFAGLPEGTVETLLRPENRDRLVEILGLHVIPGRVYRKDLLALGTARTLASDPVSFALREGRVQASGATIVAADVEASNGVIHVIDRVILPEPSSETAAPAGPAIAIIERAVSVGVPLFNHGNVEACAATYEIAIEALVALAPERLGPTLRDALQQTLARGASIRDARSRAWHYRRSMDDACVRLSRRAETSRLASSRD
jgi:uncharacterized surface protein with fasciclin (FAS1) repeats